MTPIGRLAPFCVYAPLDLLSDQQGTITKRSDPHPIRDFFLRELIDYAPKDGPEMMERPFFSLAKRKRNKAIEYTTADGSMWIKVTAHPNYGMATIWDADIIIWCISKSYRCARQAR